MAEPFLAEIRVFSFNFAPRGWAFCNGQLIPITQNTALFSLLGTTYGGDGRINFGLPDLQGSVPVHPGQGPGLSNYVRGEVGGSSEVTLIAAEMPSHTHTLNISSLEGTENSPKNMYPSGYAGVGLYAPLGSATTLMSPMMLGLAGGSQPHDNMMPYLALNFCMALEGEFPRRP